VARPLLTSTGDRAELLLGAVFVAVLLASVSVPIARGPRHVNPAIVTAVGLAAIAVSTMVSGPAVPLSIGPLTIAVNSLAAVSEEALFRRLLYGRLERLGAPFAIALSALAFALLHVPGYGIAALPVDLGAGLLLSWQRWACGSWGAPATTHVAANLVAVLR
jgi:membrane protease YdiL (CAAX protease family)